MCHVGSLSLGVTLSLLQMLGARLSQQGQRPMGHTWMANFRSGPGSEQGRRVCRRRTAARLHVVETMCMAPNVTICRHDVILSFPRRKVSGQDWLTRPLQRYGCC